MSVPPLAFGLNTRSQSYLCCSLGVVVINTYLDRFDAERWVLVTIGNSKWVGLLEGF